MKGPFSASQTRGKYANLSAKEPLNLHVFLRNF